MLWALQPDDWKVSNILLSQFTSLSGSEVLPWDSQKTAFFYLPPKGSPALVWLHTEQAPSFEILVFCPWLPQLCKLPTSPSSFFAQLSEKGVFFFSKWWGDQSANIPNSRAESSTTNKNLYCATTVPCVLPQTPAFTPQSPQSISRLWHSQSH